MRARRDGGPTVLVTVGSTRFDALVDAACCADVRGALTAYGACPILALQYGAGRAPFEDAGTPYVWHGTPCFAYEVDGVTVLTFAYTPHLSTLLHACDLVVTHGGTSDDSPGAGTLLEAMRTPHLHILAVPNPSLMHDHQRELVDALDGTYLVHGDLTYATLLTSTPLAPQLTAALAQPLAQFPPPVRGALHAAILGAWP